jgi:hypothetical protein
MKLLGDHYIQVNLKNAHRNIATELSVKAIRAELTEKSTHRQEVLERNQDRLEVEKAENEGLKSTSAVRRRKIERARRKLERIRSDNMAS